MYDSYNEGHARGYICLAEAKHGRGMHGRGETLQGDPQDLGGDWQANVGLPMEQVRGTSSQRQTIGHTCDKVSD